MHKQHVENKLVVRNVDLRLLVWTADTELPIEKMQMELHMRNGDNK